MDNLPKNRRHPDRACHCAMCTYTRGDDPDAGEFHRQVVVDDVVRYGWHVIGVLGDRHLPAWAYTVGLWHSHGVPELAMCGCPPETAAHCLNTVGGRIRDGEAFRYDEPIDRVLTSVPVVIRPVHDNWRVDLLQHIPAFYLGHPVPIGQVFWPDDGGRFPWQDGFDPRLAGRQPFLWLPKDSHPVSRWRDPDRIAGRFWPD